MISFLIKNSLLRLTVFICLSILTTHVLGQTRIDTKRVIFLKETPILFDLKNDTSVSRFTPTLEDINIIDTLLSQQFARVDFKDNRYTLIIDYYKQYVGLWIKGRKYIFINTSCRLQDYFLRNTYYPKGGGQCYFRTLVDLNEKKITEFHFNAPR